MLQLLKLCMQWLLGVCDSGMFAKGKCVLVANLIYATCVNGIFTIVAIAMIADGFYAMVMEGIASKVD